MTSWAQIKEGLGHVNSQLTAGTAVTAEVLTNVITHLAAITDLGNKMESDQSKMNMHVMAEFREVKQKALVHQGALDVLTTK